MSGDTMSRIGPGDEARLLSKLDQLTGDEVTLLLGEMKAGGGFAAA